jgi:hypothetical protein
VGALIDCIKETMPPGRTGTLSDADYAHLAAAILDKNGYTPDKQNQIIFDSAP